MTPFVHLGIERHRLCAARMLGNDYLGATLAQIGDDDVAVEGLISDQSVEADGSRRTPRTLAEH